MLFHSRWPNAFSCEPWIQFSRLTASGNHWDPSLLGQHFFTWTCGTWILWYSGITPVGALKTMCDAVAQIVLTKCKASHLNPKELLLWPLLFCVWIFGPHLVLRLFLGLCLGVTLMMLKGPYMVLGFKPELRWHSHMQGRCLTSCVVSS